MYSKRKEFYEKIEKARNSKVIAYVTGDRVNMGLQIGNDVPDVLLEHLDLIGNVNKISLILYTRGGDTLAAWNIVNLIREFCNELEVIVPNKCRSAGTLICLGANNIIMTKQATLGPIDPSIIQAMSPIIPGTLPPQKLSLSVESVRGYFNLLREEYGVKNNNSISEAYQKLVDHIHPVVLGDVYRTQKQIQMLASKLLKKANYNKKKIGKIVSFLCSDSGSHDYTINRTEARELGLNIESPEEQLYKELKAWYGDVIDELSLREPYMPVKEFDNEDEKKYSLKRGIIESVNSGQDTFVSEGILKKQVSIDVNGFQQVNIIDDRLFEGWRHFEC